MRTSQTKERLRGEVGVDFLFVDTEHGGFNLETVQDLVGAARQAGVTPFVRVGETLYSLVARVLDVGARRSLPTATA